MQQLDKISMIAAAVIVLGGIIWASTGEDKGETSESKISAAEAKILQNAASQEDFEMPAERWQDELKDCFSPKPAKGTDEWMFYRRPARLVVSPEVILVAPKHMAPRISRVEVEPDADRKAFVYKVTGEAGDSENIQDQTLTIEAREGAEGEWKEVGSVAEGDLADGFVVHDPEIVEAGKSYSFRIRSDAASATAKPIPDDEKSLSSDESLPVRLPEAEDWFCRSCQAFDPVTGTPGFAVIVRMRYNFETGEEEESKGRFSEPDNIANPTKLFDSDWGLQIVKRDEAQRRTAPQVINKKLPRDKRRRFLDVRVRAKPFTEEPWTAPEPEEGEGDEETASNAEETKPTEDDTSSDEGSIFGDDEDD